MTIRNRPNYGVFLINLTNAGAMDIPCLATRIAMTGALLNATIGSLPGGQQGITGGTPSAGNVNVQIGKTLGDALPFTPGCKVQVANKFEFVRLSWAAQTNVTAVIIISDDADGNGVSMDAPPSVTLGTISLSEGGNTALITTDGALLIAPGSNPLTGYGPKAPSVTTTAAQIDTLTTVISRKISAPLTNTSIVYLGNAAVTTANGFPLFPGDSVEIEGGNAPFAICAAGTQKLNSLAIVG